MITVSIDGKEFKTNLTIDELIAAFPGHTVVLINKEAL